MSIVLTQGEIPKRLKGLPWKGSRSLIAARGFKSLFLRLLRIKFLFKSSLKNVQKNMKKVLDIKRQKCYYDLADSRETATKQEP